MRDLSQVRAAYERGEGSLRELAEKFLVAERTLFRRASAEKWLQGAAESGSGIEESGSTHPKNGSAPLENAAKNGSAEEKFGSTTPENGSGTSDFGSTFSQSGSSRPENGSTRSIFDAQVTTYPNAMSPDCPAVDTAASVLHAIRSGEFRGQIESLRRILGRDGKAAYDRAKTKLLAFCVSGTTNDRNRLLKHSNLLQIDFDGLNGQLADARRKMVADPHAAAVFTSPSGVGLKVLLRIDGVRHEESVAAAADYFPRTYGLKPDPQVKEPARLCFVSYDPDVFANPLAEPLPLPEPPPKKKSSKSEKSWWTEFRGDLQTLDLVAAFREAGFLGERLDPDSGKWTVRCPWAQTHGNGGRDRRNNDSSTVIFACEDSHAFKCLHAHCADRKLKDALLWIESEHPGLIDRHCKKLRSAFANEALKKKGLHSPWGEPLKGADAVLVEKNGSPFYYRTGKDGEREVTDFNPHYWTARFAFENLVIFEPHNNQFYSYQEETGIWTWQTDAAIRAELAAWMLEYSRSLN